MNSDEAGRPNKPQFFASELPLGLSFSVSPRYEWVTCTAAGCQRRMRVKVSKRILKKERTVRCPACESAWVLSSAAQGSVAAECAARNRAARERRNAKAKTSK